MKFNPFASITPKRADREVRLPLDDADMKTIKREIGRLDKSDQLLLRLLGATGMRLSEAFEIDSEKTERGVRYVIVGHKTEQSKRRVPLPKAVLPELRKSIKRPLFDDGPRVEARASKRLNRFLREIGIVDTRKVVHSLRHRAKIGCARLDVRSTCNTNCSGMSKRPWPVVTARGTRCRCLSARSTRSAFEHVGRRC